MIEQDTRLLILYACICAIMVIADAVDRWNTPNGGGGSQSGVGAF